MTLRQCCESLPSLRWIASRLEILSAPGRRALYDTPWLTQSADIEHALDGVQQLAALFNDGQPADSADAIRLQLMQIKEIQGTAARLSAHATLDDIELFELKAFAITAITLREHVVQAGITHVDIPDLTSVADLLDPRHTRVPHFYLYDDYSETLAELRSKLKAANATGNPETDRLYADLETEEDRVRQVLSRQLATYAQQVENAIAQVAHLDVLQAKGAMASRWRLTRPVIGCDASQFAALINPQVAEALAARNKRFQPVDIALYAGPTVITGANMGGKSVLLKTVALAQSMAQLGMFIPAAHAIIAPVQEVLLCIGDDQNELNGLSSFASEMLRIDSILRTIDSGVHAMALIDEPARTTNPTEGKALVEALVKRLAAKGCSSLITTHYSGVGRTLRRLRVRGFTSESLDTPLRAKDINDYMDYRLTEGNDDVPQEALRIARMLGVDTALLDTAATYLDKT